LWVGGLHPVLARSRVAASHGERAARARPTTAFVTAALVAAALAPIAWPVHAALPDAPLVVETDTAAFTPTWELVLDEGRVHRRAASATSGATAKSGATGTTWHLVPPGGVPVPSARIEVMKELIVPIVSRPFEPAARLVALSADGDNLIVVDERRRVYYAKLGADPARVGTWADVWGPLGFAAPLVLPRDTLDWAISHRAQPYQDIDGNPHPISAGVTTLYALFPGPSGAPSGSRIAYQDPWLPPPSMEGAAWQREVCPPERGALTLLSMAASASTLAVMDDGGLVHTRLADFDTLGHNPALPYSWRRERRQGLEANVRSLPPEDWRLQPRIPGPHTSALTVFFTGAGNSKRRLRVVGTSTKGDPGYWEKDLADAAWRFVASPHARSLAAPLVAPREPTRRAPRGETLTTKIGKATAIVEGFSLACPGATVRVTRDTDGKQEEVRLALWHTERLIELDRREHDLRGALILEGDPKGQLADDVRTLFGGANVHEVEIDVTPRTVEVKSATANLKKMKRPLSVRLTRPRTDSRAD
jgi:hypothetical protein